MDAPAEELFQLLPRGLADRLDGFALVAQHDALVAVAGDIDHLVDPGRAILALFPVLGFHRHLVGQFLVQAQGSRVISAAIMRMGRSAIWSSG